MSAYRFQVTNIKVEEGLLRPWPVTRRRLRGSMPFPMRLSWCLSYLILPIFDRALALVTVGLGRFIVTRPRDFSLVVHAGDPEGVPGLV